MKKSILTFVLCTLSLCTFSQEAFYIYRNDGDFNGFFYDEVQEMRYSKLALDSTEHEQYVTYEVVLADTIYRIPLATIDSIGFQQPEIKFNPKVKFIEKDGYSPYIYLSGFVMGWGVEKQTYYFRNLPDNMVPQAGDVLIGLSSDTHADLYRDGGSFSCIVESVTLFDNEDDQGPFKMCKVKGRYVENLDEVFTRFVMVEQIGYDKEGNQIMHRASARMPEGFPQPKRVKKASDESEVTLIDFESTITRQWMPDGASGSTSIELSADVGIQVKFRVAYNISWTRMMITIDNDVITKVKPSIAANISKGEEYRLGDIITYPRNIKLPIQCPIFELDPSPDIFLRFEGKMQAKFNLPQVRIGVGVHYGVDTDNLFPVSCGIHLVPDDAPEPDESMLDLSSEVSFDTYLQTGLKFGASLSTNSWIKKIFYGQIGLYLYAGPKIGGRVNITADILNGNGATLYSSLAYAYLYATALSLDLEAKATAAVFWKDPIEKKFFDKNWSFGRDTLRLAPLVDSVRSNVSGQDATVSIYLRPNKILPTTRMRVGIFDDDTPVFETGDQVIYGNLSKNYKLDYSFSIADFKAKTYDIKPIISSGLMNPYPIYVSRSYLKIPMTYEADTDSLIFEPEDNSTASVEFTTNAAAVHVTDYPTWVMLQKLDTLDKAKGRYRATFKADFNNGLFDRSIPKAEQMKGIVLGVPNPAEDHYLGMYQKENNLQHVEFALSILTGGGNAEAIYFEQHPVTATRIGKDKIKVQGHYVKTSDGGWTEECTIDLTLTRLGNTPNYTMDGTASRILEGHSYNEIDRYVNNATIVGTSNSKGIVSHATSVHSKIVDGQETVIENIERNNFNSYSVSVTVLP